MPSSSSIEHTLEMLRAHDRVDTASRIAIGEHLFDSYFESNETLVRSTDNTKLKHFGELARRAKEETSWSRWDLRAAVISFLVSRTIGRDVAERIQAAFLPRLDAVEEPARSDLADKLARRVLRGERAESAIVAATGKNRSGRKASPRALLAAMDLERLGRRLEDEGAFGAEAVRVAAERGVAGRAAGALEAHLERVQQFLRLLRKA